MSVAEENDRVDRLERRLANLEERLGRIEARLPEEAPTDTSTRFETVEAGTREAATSGEEAPLLGGPVRGPMPGPQATGEPAPQRQPPEPNPRGFEERFGADWLAKAGMVVLVLGVVFALKYAFDNDWIGLTGRVVLGVVGGAALWVTGELLSRRERYGRYPQVLAGGGAVIAYFSLYAAYAFEDYRAATGMTLQLDALLLGLLALGLAGYATWRKMSTLAGLAVGLGALTALVAGSLDAFSVVYLVVLTAVVTVACAYRSWVGVAAFALGASHLTLGIDLAAGVNPVAIMWGAGLLLVVFTVAALRAPRTAEPAVFGATLAASAGLLAIWGIAQGGFVVFGLVYVVALGAALITVALVARSATVALAGLVATLASLAVALTPVSEVEPMPVLWTTGVLLVLFAGAATALREHEQPGAASATALLAAGTVLGAWGLFLWGLSLEEATHLRGPVTLGLAIASGGLALLPLATDRARAGWAAASAVTALAWAPIQFDGELTVVAWAVLLATGAVARFRWTTAGLRLGTVVATGLLTVHLIAIEAPALEDGELGPWLGAGVFLLATASSALAWRAEAVKNPQDALLHRGLLAATVLAPVVFVAATYQGFGVSIGWSVLALTLVVLGFTTRQQDLRLASLVLFALVLGRVFLVDMAELEVGVRIITFLVVGAILLGASFLYARAQGTEVEEA